MDDDFEMSENDSEEEGKAHHGHPIGQEQWIISTLELLGIDFSLVARL